MLALAEAPAHLTDVAGFAKELGASEVVAVAAGPRGEVEARAFKAFARVYYAGDRPLTDQLVAVLDKLYDEVGPDVVVGPATKNGNEVIARLAARRSLPMVTEVIEARVGADGTLDLVRLVLGGRCRAVLKVTRPAALTIQLRRWGYEGEVGAELVEAQLPGTAYRVVEVREKAREAVNIEEAEVVVGVGRGFRRKEDLKMAEELASLLGGVVGCTRPIAADYGWLSEDRWIGISGKRIRPRLYIAIGISGAPQHMAAAMDSKVIVAVNKDKNAPIFQYADYGVVADLYQFVPVLIERLKRRLGRA